MPNRTSGPGQWLVAYTVVAIVLGIAFRYSNAAHKIYWRDEAVTSVRVAGYTLAEYQGLYDDVPHQFGEIQRLLRPNPKRGVFDTVHSLAIEDPQHPPAFYVMESVWTRAVGNTPFLTRLLPVLLSLLALPLTYQLAVELFRSRTVGYVATALLSVSPFFVLYAYQAREYGFLTVVILLSSLLFLRAERLGRWTRWAWYALSVALGMYTYLLFVFVVAAHAIAALFKSNLRLASLLPFLMSASCGFLLASPWLTIALQNRAAAEAGLRWGFLDYSSPQTMIAKWLFFAGATFFDLEYASGRLAFLITLIVLALIIAAIIHLVRKEHAFSTVFLAALAGTTFLGLAIPDLALHHRYSTTARFLSPTWLALLFVVAAFVGSRFQSWMARATFTFLLAVAIASNVISSQSSSWWENNVNKASPQLATLLNTHPRLLVVSTADPGPLLDLAPFVMPKARWLGYRTGTPPQRFIPAAERRVYLLSPSEIDRRLLAQDSQLTLRLVYDSHDFSTNLTRFRSVTTGQHRAGNDWGEMVLWSVERRGVSAL